MSKGSRDLTVNRVWLPRSLPEESDILILTSMMSPSIHFFPTAIRASISAVLLLGFSLTAKADEFDPEGRLAELEIELPTPAKSIANYVRATRIGNTLYLSGHLPKQGNKKVSTFSFRRQA